MELKFKDKRALNEYVQRFGIRAWGSQRTDLGEQFCGTGAGFDPLLPNLDELGQPIWSYGFARPCVSDDGDPLRPIPAMTALGKGLSALLVIGAGVLAVARSRRRAAA